MNAKTPLFLLLGMCFSFSLVLAVMLAVTPHPALTERRPAPAQRPRAPAPPPPQLRQAAPAPLPVPKNAPASASARPFDFTPSAIASQELDQVKKELRQQIAELKKDRDRMLDELVRQLKTLPASEAAAQMEPLDDESAVLVLLRLSALQRQAVLKCLEPKRASRLSQALAPTPSR